MSYTLFQAPGVAPPPRRKLSLCMLLFPGLSVSTEVLGQVLAPHSPWWVHRHRRMCTGLMRGRRWCLERQQPQQSGCSCNRECGKGSILSDHRLRPHKDKSVMSVYTCLSRHWSSPSSFSGSQVRPVSGTHRASGGWWREAPTETLRKVSPTPVCPPFLVSWLLGMFRVHSPPGLSCAKEKKLILCFIYSKAKKSAGGKFTSELMVADKTWQRKGSGRLRDTIHSLIHSADTLFLKRKSSHQQDREMVWDPEALRSPLISHPTPTFKQLLLPISSFGVYPRNYSFPLISRNQFKKEKELACWH